MTFPANIDLWCNGKRNRLITDKVGAQIPSGQPSGGFHFLSTPENPPLGAPSASMKELFCVVWNQRGTGRRDFQNFHKDTSKTNPKSNTPKPKSPSSSLRFCLSPKQFHIYKNTFNKENKTSWHLHSKYSA